jgi:hypothetical protein
MEYGQLKETWDDMVASRRTFEMDWQDIVGLVRVNTSDVLLTKTPGESRVDEIYDSTALDANMELASGLHSFLTNPAERWFSIGVQGVPTDALDDDALDWLEQVSDFIFAHYHSPNSGFNTALHECYLDVGAFGTCCPYQSWNANKRSLSFRSFPMADIYFRENGEGKIDSVGRRIFWTGRQLEQEFESLPSGVSRHVKAAPNQPVEVVHLTLPLTDFNKGFGVGSYWLCPRTKELIAEGGFDRLPYHPARWLKLANEVYGRGPASTCLPDIRMVNVMEKILIKAGSKAVDPPLVIPDEGYVLPIATEPSSINWKEADSPMIETLVHKGNLPWGLEHANQKRETIRKCFHSDWLRLEKANKEMTAFEVSDRRNEKLSLLAPMLGRVQSEMLGTMVGRSYRLLDRHNQLPPAPASLHGVKLEVVYTSPAARAQTAAKATQMSKFIQDLIPIVQIKQDVIDVIDMDLYAQKLAEYGGSPRSVIRSPEEIAAIRQQRQEQEQLAQMAQTLEPASKAVKNIADAQESVPPAFTL